MLKLQTTVDLQQMLRPAVQPGATIDHEWPALKAAYETWLDPGNFDGHGKQQQSLGALTAAALGVNP